MSAEAMSAPVLSQLLIMCIFFGHVMQGLASGTTSLLSGVFIGGAAGVLSAASAGTTIVGHFASALTFDPQYRRRRQLLQQQHAARTSQVSIGSARPALLIFKLTTT